MSTVTLGIIGGGQLGSMLAMAAKKLGVNDPVRKYDIDDMVKGDIIFCASGVTSGDLADGIRCFGNKYEVTTLALHKSQKINKVIKNIYNK